MEEIILGKASPEQIEKWLRTFLNIIQALAVIDKNPQNVIAITVTVKIIEVIIDVVLAFKNGGNVETAASAVYDRIKGNAAFIADHVGEMKNIVDKIFHQANPEALEIAMKMVQTQNQDTV